jgi:hypothetical protein
VKREVKETVAPGHATKLYDPTLRLRASTIGYGKQETDGMLKKLAVAIGALGLSAGALGYATPAQAQGVQAVQAGTLSCHVAGGFGFIFGSSRALACAFSPTSGSPEQYNGTINTFGVDIGYMRSAVIIWTVLAPTTTLGPGALAGTFAGVTASVAAGVGVGANILVGGSGNTVSLQPLSISGGVGLNVAGGIGSITLTFQPG